MPTLRRLDKGFRHQRAIEPLRPLEQPGTMEHRLDIVYWKFLTHAYLRKNMLLKVLKKRSPISCQTRQIRNALVTVKLTKSVSLRILRFFCIQLGFFCLMSNFDSVSPSSLLWRDHPSLNAILPARAIGGEQAVTPERYSASFIRNTTIGGVEYIMCLLRPLALGPSVIKRL